MQKLLERWLREWKVKDDISEEKMIMMKVNVEGVLWMNTHENTAV
jgi:hypothetical protein